MKNNKRTFQSFQSILLGLALVSPVLAFDEEVAQRTGAAALAQAAGAKAAAERKAKTDKLSAKEKLSYALGIRVGSDLKYESLEVEPDLFLQAIKDVFAGNKTLLTAEEIHSILTELQADLKRKQESREAERVLATNQLAEKNKKEGEAFLAENKAKEGVVTLESGLQYKILKAGEGKKPTLSDTVTCQYRGTFIDGKEFDSSGRRKAPATAPLTKMIKGWSQALQLMPVGSKWQLFVPANLAYGARGASIGIGPNATLIYEVELLSIQEKSQDKS